MDIDDIRFKIAAARRILARNGCESQVAGHVSARADGEDAFWVSPFEYFDETLPDRVVKASFDLALLEGDWEPSPAIQFHAAIYQLASKACSAGQSVVEENLCLQPLAAFGRKRRSIFRHQPEASAP